MHAGALARSGQTRAAEELRQTLADGEACGASLGLMEYYLFRQDIDRAAHWARKSIDQRDLVVPFLLRHPNADLLRNGSHWPSLAKMMNLPTDVP
jgi:hypothetical protein